MSGQDVIVVGAGILGLLTAYECRRRGATVCLLDQQAPGRAASWAGGGILAPLNPQQESAQLSQLFQESQGYYPRLSARLWRDHGMDIGYRCTGIVGVEQPVAACLAWAQQYQQQAQQLEQDACQQQVPQLGRHIRSAILYPELGQIRNPHVLQALLRLLQADPGCLIRSHEPVQALLGTSGRAIGVSTPQGRYLAADIVLTLGAWSGDFCRRLGFLNDIHPVKGQMLAVQTPANWLQRIVVSPDVYLIPRADGLVLVGSSVERVGFCQQPTAAVQATLWQAACDLVPTLQQWPVVHHWAGLRPGASRPLLQTLPDRSNVFLAAGHFRLGLTTAPASVARIMAHLAAPVAQREVS